MAKGAALGFAYANFKRQENFLVGKIDQEVKPIVQAAVSTDEFCRKADCRYTDVSNNVRRRRR